MIEIHLQNIYYFFTKYMFGVTDPTKLEEIEPQIVKPTQFDIYSSSELTNQFAEAKKAKLNSSYLQVKQAEIQNKEFQTNPRLCCNKRIRQKSYGKHSLYSKRR
jgi:hypothetical protein